MRSAGLMREGENTSASTSSMSFSTPATTGK
jgi:hypothetical protein